MTTAAGTPAITSPSIPPRSLPYEHLERMFLDATVLRFVCQGGRRPKAVGGRRQAEGGMVECRSLTGSGKPPCLPRDYWHRGAGQARRAPTGQHAAMALATRR